MSLITAKKITMTSREIAELTGKSHAHVMRDIRAMVDAIGQNPSLDSAFKSTAYTGGNGQSYPQYEIDKDLTLTLLTGYDTNARYKVVKRWQELEGSQPAMTQSELVLWSAQRLVDLEREQLALKAEQETIKHQMAALLDGENYLTVAGYCNLTKRRLDQRETARYGKLATAVCKERGHDIGRAIHPLYGEVNSYPHEVLAEVFGD